MWLQKYFPEKLFFLFLIFDFLVLYKPNIFINEHMLINTTNARVVEDDKKNTHIRHLCHMGKSNNMNIKN